MKIKKFNAILLAGLMLTACGNQKAEKTENETKTEAKAETEDKTETKEEAAPAEAMESMPEGANVVKENLPIDEPETNGEKITKLPNFTSKDQDGKDFTNEDIAKNDATVINLWFTGCSACIDEMDELNDLADELNKEDGVEFLSMCTDVNYDESTKEAFDRIIADKKPTYKTLAVDYEGEMKDYLENIFAYPTTIVVDKNGNIIGDPIEGALIPKEQVAKLKENIKKAVESSKNS